jgi:DNA-binding GntR family transcriptional regulator
VQVLDKDKPSLYHTDNKSYKKYNIESLPVSNIQNTPLSDHKQLHNVVIDRLRDMIMHGDLRAGEWLRQERLARELGVSHTPIREALKQLEIEGLVEHVPYRGVRVIEFSPEDVVDIYEMRSALEGIAAAAAASCMTNDELVRVRYLHESMIAIEHPAEHLQEVRELNRQFHLSIIQGSRRTHLSRTLEQLWAWFPTMLWNQYALAADASTPQRAGKDNWDHEQIVEALEARDSAAAEQRMREHIDRTRDALMHHLNTVIAASQK